MILPSNASGYSELMHGVIQDENTTFAGGPIGNSEPVVVHLVLPVSLQACIVR